MSNILPHGHRLTWLGHSTALYVTPKARVLFDPWTRSNPACPESHKSPGPLDLVLITHGHSDHMGDALTVAAETGAHFVANYEIALYLMGHGVDPGRVHPMNRGGSIAFPALGLSVTQTVALHSSGIDTDAGVVYGGEAGGYVVTTDDGATLYHAGDTALFSDLRLIADLYAPTVALLPIGDRFTMGPREAAVAVELLHSVKTVIPIHWGTFGLLTGTPDALQQALVARGVETNIARLAPGESVGG